MVFIQAILYSDKPPIADIFMAKQPIFEVGSSAMKTRMFAYAFTLRHLSPS